MATIPTQRPFRTRTWALFAAEAPVAVILRRGPKRHFRLIQWDLARDTFELGQWMKGIITLCDLSPDGAKLIYRASQYRTPIRRVMAARVFDPLAPRQLPRGVRRPRPHRKVPRYQRDALAETPGAVRRLDTDWTAISTPPYFSALALWPAHGRWTGGGVFVDGGIVLFESADGMMPMVNVEMPASLAVRRRLDGEWPLPSAHVPAQWRGEAADSALWAAMTDAGIADLDWVTRAMGDDLLFAADGYIYRLANWRDLPAKDYIAHARCLIDLEPMLFEMIAPAETAMRW